MRLDKVFYAEIKDFIGFMGVKSFRFFMEDEKLRLEFFGILYDIRKIDIGFCGCKKYVLVLFCIKKEMLLGLYAKLGDSMFFVRIYYDNYFVKSEESAGYF